MNSILRACEDPVIAVLVSFEAEDTKLFDFKSWNVIGFTLFFDDAVEFQVQPLISDDVYSDIGVLSSTDYGGAIANHVYVRTLTTQLGKTKIQLNGPTNGEIIFYVTSR